MSSSFPVKCNICGSVMGSLRMYGHLKRIHKITKPFVNANEYFTRWHHKR